MSLSSSKELEVKSTAKPNWLQLPTDVTADILFRLDTYEIMKNVRNVCPLWWKICKNPIMWQTIYMGNFDRVCLPQYQILELGMKLPLLEELNISITVWNGYCLPIKLKTFHQLPSEITDKCNADPFAIAKSMPGLRRLNISGHPMYQGCLLFLMDVLVLNLLTLADVSILNLVKIWRKGVANRSKN
ncbi:putative F-box protein At4g05475 [Medicago truncatula]|nr:putative F-box protein At4g05475 [Medicago truncatula]